MSVYSDIDSLVSQANAIASQARTASANKDEGPPPGSTDKLITGNGGSPVPPPPDEGPPPGSTGGQKVDASGSNGSTGSSGTQKDTDSTDSGHSASGLVPAIGQNLTRTWKEEIRPALAEVNPQVWYALGGGLGVLLILQSLKKKN